MVEIVLKIIAACFCIIGLAEVLHMIKQFLLKPRHYPEVKAFVYLEKYPLEQLGSVAEEFRWSKSVKAGSLCAVCKGVSEEEYSECLKIAEKYGIELEYKE